MQLQNSAEETQERQTDVQNQTTQRRQAMQRRLVELTDIEHKTTQQLELTLRELNSKPENDSKISSTIYIIKRQLKLRQLKRNIQSGERNIKKLEKKRAYLEQHAKSSLNLLQDILWSDAIFWALLMLNVIISLCEKPQKWQYSSLTTIGVVILNLIVRGFNLKKKIQARKELKNKNIKKFKIIEEKIKYL